MKRLFISFVMLICLFASPVLIHADEIQPQPAVSFPLSLQGDTSYIFHEKSLNVGTSLTLANGFYGIIELKGLASASVNADHQPMFGLGLGVNIPNLLKHIGYASWTSIFMPTISVSEFVKLGSPMRFEPGFTLTIISIPLK